MIATYCQVMLVAILQIVGLLLCNELRASLLSFQDFCELDHKRMAPFSLPNKQNMARIQSCKMHEYL